MKKILILILLIITISSFSCKNSGGKSPFEEKKLSYSIKTLDTSYTREQYIKELSEIVDTSNFNRFKQEIDKFQAVDSLYGIQKKSNLFIGSSSIRKWGSLSADMEPKSLINRGFGGSTIGEIIWYADKIVFPYEPLKIFFYAGENDIANNDTKAIDAYNAFVLFVKIVNFYMPDTKIYYISIKPSYARLQYSDKFAEANKMIEKYCNTKKNLYYIDIFSKMYETDGSIKKDIFLKDKLHLNKKGYSIWTKAIFEYL